ncbi:MAG: iron chelate uptake ABC transporter family permease subunit [Pseudomonadota bacterium]
MNVAAGAMPRSQGLGDTRRLRILICLAVALLGCLGWALSSGAVSLSLWELAVQDDRQFERTIFVEIRSPRVLLAAGVGAALALSGAALQGLFRNPLADPALIGVSSGAALGAIAMIVLGANLTLGWLTPYLLPLAAVAGAILATLFLYAFANRYGRFNVITMLLVGIAINAIAMVGVGAFQYLSSENQLRTLVFWMMGSFGRATWPTVIPAMILLVGAGAVLLRQARELDLLQLGEAQARHLGVDLPRTKRRVVLLSAAAVGAGVAVSGIIGFVGLVVPHLMRLLGGPAHRYILPASALAGATLMVLADLVARTIATPAEVPVGLVTSALGAPFFLWLIARVRPA